MGKVSKRRRARRSGRPDKNAGGATRRRGRPHAADWPATLARLLLAGVLVLLVATWAAQGGLYAACAGLAGLATVAGVLDAVVLRRRRRALAWLAGAVGLLLAAGLLIDPAALGNALSAAAVPGALLALVGVLWLAQRYRR